MLLAALVPTKTSAGSATISCPATGPRTGGAFTSEITIDVGTHPLGAYTLTITYDPAFVTIASVDGGTTLEFASAPIANPGDFASGHTLISAFNSTSAMSPMGTVSVARPSFSVVGVAGSSPALGLELMTLVDTDGQPIATSAGGCTVPVVPAVDLSNGVGRPGGMACVAATFTANGAEVARVTNEIGVDAGVFTIGSCTINPLIGVNTTADKQLSHNAVGPGMEQVDVFGNMNVIPDGLLHTCTLAIDVGAGVGAHSLSNTPQAADPGGNPIAGVGGVAGQIFVTTCTGDCNGNGRVTIGEVIKCVNLFLGQPFCNPRNASLSCPVADANLSGVVSIGEVVGCVNQFLNGC